MTEIDETGTDESTEVAHQALVGLCNQLVDQIAAGRAEVAVRQALALSAPLHDPPRSREFRHLGPLARSTAEAANPDLPATPDRPGGHFCDICGCADEKQIEPGPDKDHFGAENCAWMCKDERACEARKLHRYPPRPDLVPEAFLSALSAEDEAKAARHRQQPPAGQQEPPAAQDQPPVPAYRPPVPGWSFTQYGSMDPLGNFHPAPQYGPYAHTLMNPAHRQHLLSGQSRPHYYTGQLATEGAQPPQDGSQAQQGPGIPPVGVPEGVRQSLEDGHAGDMEMIPHPQPAARPQRPPRDRFGRRRQLKYQGRR